MKKQVRSKPQVYNAIQWTSGNTSELIANGPSTLIFCGDECEFRINTGWQVVRQGDWILRDEHGIFLVVRNDEFQEQFEIIR